MKNLFSALKAIGAMNADFMRAVNAFPRILQLPELLCSVINKPLDLPPSSEWRAPVTHGELPPLKSIIDRPPRFGTN